MPATTTSSAATSCSGGGHPLIEYESYSSSSSVPSSTTSSTGTAESDDYIYEIALSSLLRPSSNVNKSLHRRKPSTTTELLLQPSPAADPLYGRQPTPPTEHYYFGSGAAITTNGSVASAAAAGAENTYESLFSPAADRNDLMVIRQNQSPMNHSTQDHRRGPTATERIHFSGAVRGGHQPNIHHRNNFVALPLPPGSCGSGSWGVTGGKSHRRSWQHFTALQKTSFTANKASASTENKKYQRKNQQQRSSGRQQQQTVVIAEDAIDRLYKEHYRRKRRQENSTAAAAGDNGCYNSKDCNCFYSITAAEAVAYNSHLRKQQDYDQDDHQNPKPLGFDSNSSSSSGSHNRNHSSSSSTDDNAYGAAAAAVDDCYCGLRNSSTKIAVPAPNGFQPQPHQQRPSDSAIGIRRNIESIAENALSIIQDLRSLLTDEGNNSQQNKDEDKNDINKMTKTCDDSDGGVAKNLIRPNPTDDSRQRLPLLLNYASSKSLAKHELQQNVISNIKESSNLYDELPSSADEENDDYQTHEKVETRENDDELAAFLEPIYEEIPELSPQQRVLQKPPPPLPPRTYLSMPRYYYFYNSSDNSPNRIISKRSSAIVGNNDIIRLENAIRFRDKNGRSSGHRLRSSDKEERNTTSNKSRLACRRASLPPPAPTPDIDEFHHYCRRRYFNNNNINNNNQEGGPTSQQQQQQQKRPVSSIVFNNSNHETTENNQISSAAGHLHQHQRPMSSVFVTDGRHIIRGRQRNETSNIPDDTDQQRRQHDNSKATNGNQQRQSLSSNRDNNSSRQGQHKLGGNQSSAVNDDEETSCNRSRKDYSSSSNQIDRHKSIHDSSQLTKIQLFPESATAAAARRRKLLYSFTKV